MNAEPVKRRHATEFEMERFQRAIKEARERPSRAFRRAQDGSCLACAEIPGNIKRDLDEAYWRRLLDEQIMGSGGVGFAVGLPHDPEVVSCGLGIAGEWPEFVRTQMANMADRDDPEVMRLRFPEWSVIVWGTVANLTGLSVEVMLQAKLVARWRKAAEEGMLLKEMPPL